MRRHETAKDYKTLTDKAVNWTMCDNLQDLILYIDDSVKAKTLLRSEAVKISVAINNLLNDLGVN